MHFVFTSLDKRIKKNLNEYNKEEDPGDKCVGGWRICFEYSKEGFKNEQKICQQLEESIDIKFM